MRRFSFWFLLAVLIGLTLTFGGMHTDALSFAQCVVFGFFVIIPIAMTRGAFVATRSSFGAFSRLTLLCLLTMAIVPLAQPTLAQQVTLLRTAIPAFEKIWLTPAVFSCIRFLFFVIAAFVLFRFALTRGTAFAAACIRSIGTAVALTALAHWLSDNGKLFWIFEPDFVFESSRARWPFVNSDHLAHFLLPSFFLFVGSLKESSISMSAFMLRNEHETKAEFASLLASPSFQRRLSALLLLLVQFLIVSLAIAATLSRSAWLAVSAGSMAFLLLDSVVISKLKSAPSRLDLAETEDADAVPESRRRRRPFSRSELDRTSLLNFTKFIRPLLFIGAVSVFLFFLNERGTELVSARIEFGVLHSKDDVRWQMYHDTLPIIEQHPWAGVGVGNWNAFFNRSMNSDLSEINPVYLHSDPLQWLAETGLIGFTPVAVLLSAFTFLAIARLKRLNMHACALAVALLVGLWSTLLASCFDFPFRIPAISFQCALLLALLCSVLESPDADTDASIVQRGKSSRNLIGEDFVEVRTDSLRTHRHDA